MPHGVIHDRRGDDVGVDPGEPPVGPVEASDVVPGAGEGEPDGEGAFLQEDPAVDGHRLVELHGLGEGDDDVLPPQDDPLVVDAQVVGEAPVVDRDSRDGPG